MSGPSDTGSTIASENATATLNEKIEFSGAQLITLVQGWIDSPGSNNGILIKASDADENGGVDNRKIFRAKGFPLETSTNLSQAQAEAQHPMPRVAPQGPL